MAEQPDIDRLADRVREGIFGGPGPVTAALDELVALARDSDSMALANELATVGSNLLAAEALADRNEELMRRAEAKRFSAETRAEAAEARVAELEGLLKAGSDACDVLNGEVARRDERVAELEAALRQIERDKTHAIAIARAALAGDGGGA